MQKGEIKVKINGSNWKVIITDNKQDLTDKYGHICKGTVSYRLSTIYLDNTVSRENAAHILRHELSHIYLYETQLAQKDIYTEEELCEFTAIYGMRIVNKANNILKRIR